MKKLFFTCTLLFGILACSDDDGSDAPLKGDGEAKIDGATFKPDKTTTTNTGSGLEIKLADGADEIILRLEDDVAGNYSILNSVPGGRTKALDAYAECIKSGDVYYGTSGTIALTVNTDGTVTGTFTFDASTIDGDDLEITGGTFTGVEIGNLEKFGCLVKSASNGDYTEEYEYNADGQLVRVSYSESGESSSSFYTLSYVNGVLASAVEADTYNGTTEIDYNKYTITSSNNRITKIRSTDEDGDYYETTFTYDGSGRINSTSSVEFYDGQTYNDCKELITYSGENVSKEENEAGCDYEDTSTFTNYDTKENPAQLFIKALGNSKALAYFLIFGTTGLSKNNLGKESEMYSYDGGEPSTYSATYTYVYNSKNYPTKITEVDDYGTDVTNITYLNCN